MRKSRTTFNQAKSPKPAKGMLLRAATVGDTEGVRSLLAGGADVDERAADGMTPLMYAAVNGHDDCLRLLIDKGADVNATDAGGDTPLILTADGNEPACAQILLENGARIDVPRANGETPLITALRRRHAEVALTFIGKGANVDQETPDGEPALVFSAAGGPQLNAVSIGLINKGANLECFGPAGATPLICAAWADNPELARYLARKGANLDATMDGRTAMDIATSKGFHEVMDALADAHADRERLRLAAIQKSADGFSEGLRKPITAGKPLTFKSRPQ